MPRTQPFLALAILACVACPACAEDYDETDPRFLPDTTGNSGGGTVFNTNEMDQVGFSEITPALDSDSDPQAAKDPGGMMPGFTLASLVLESGVLIEDFAVEEGAIIGHDALDDKYAGALLLRSEWTIDPPSNIDPPIDGPLTMRLKEILPWGDGFPRYRFESTSGTTPGPTCPAGPNGPGVTRLLTGFSLNEHTGAVRNAPGTTYLACNTGATGKAADLGFYDLVSDDAEDDAAWNPFEVAIRVIRADYCYSGTSYTLPGTPIIIEDRWGVMDPPPPGQQAPIEAVWGAHGLVCRGTGRQTNITCPNSPPPCAAKDLSSYPAGLFLTRLPVFQEESTDPVPPV